MINIEDFFKHQQVTKYIRNNFIFFKIITPRAIYEYLHKQIRNKHYDELPLKGSFFLLN